LQPPDSAVKLVTTPCPTPARPAKNVMDRCGAVAAAGGYCAASTELPETRNPRARAREGSGSGACAR
jgi:hypothetical protein